MKKFLSGKKSYLIALGIAAVVFLKATGNIDPETANTLLGLLGAGSVASLKAAAKKAEPVKSE